MPWRRIGVAIGVIIVAVDIGGSRRQLGGRLGVVFAGDRGLAYVALACKEQETGRIGEKSRRMHCSTIVHGADQNARFPLRPS
jgi:hypothetical protein